MPDMTLLKTKSESTLTEYISKISRMQTEEEFEKQGYEMASEDAISTLNDLIATARELMGLENAFDLIGHDEHDFPYSEWQQEVANGDTRRGYADWVLSNREQVADERAANREYRGS